MHVAPFIAIQPKYYISNNQHAGVSEQTNRSFISRTLNSDRHTLSQLNTSISSKSLKYNYFFHKYQVQMQQDQYEEHSNRPSTLATAYQSLKAEIENNIKEKYPKAYYYDEKNNLCIKKIDQLEEENPSGDSESRSKEGRGGNNCSENLKKSLKAVIKNILKPELYPEFQENYINRYQLKSQKENYILIFMFLHHFIAEKKLSFELIGKIEALVKKNIQKYIRNSEERIQERSNFHSKNIREFEKYLEFDINFTRRRSFDEIEEYIGRLFLRKKAVATKSIDKVRKIVMENTFLKNIFFQQEEAKESNLQNMEKIEEEPGQQITVIPPAINKQ